ncbi:MAG: CRISPR-associated helicase Cas3' [Thermacetogeniaceae bacterium]
MDNERQCSHSQVVKEFIAHCRKKDGAKQSLWHHLTGVSLLAGRFASKIGLEKQGELIGLLHDLGKASLEFDQYIRSATGLIDPDEDGYVDSKEKKGKIDHSSAGAQFIYQHYFNKGKESLWVSQILSLIIASHHTGLIDCLTTDGVDNYSRRMNKPAEKTRVEEAVLNLDDSIKLKIETILSNSQFINVFNQKLVSLQQNNDSSETMMFKSGLLIKFIFSCLIDADRLDTADFEFPEYAKQRNQGYYKEWSILIERLEIYLSRFNSNSKVNMLRQDISNHCLEFSNKPKGLYQLTVPTGGGKTLSSLRFALNHAKKHNMDRIIYVIPFTSIIDQNAQKAREALEEQMPDGSYLNNIVLEHHSNLTPESENARQKLLSENWDMPVVYTTMVHFLESLFSSGTRDARRMHQLANAVIIFDEIQTLPIRCVHLFNLAVRFLIENCGSTVVLCTATQPLLDKITPVQRALQITPEQQMMPDVHRLFQELKRVIVYDRRKKAGWTDSDVAELVKQELDLTGSVLIVVNTKKEAINLFQELEKCQSAKIFHLSTNMCPAHRIIILNEIRELLGEEPVICVSTQLIEAGIDIDFGSVIRYLAGLDSIGQAAGRCNRNGNRPMPGRVFIINPKDENLDRLKDIRIGKERAERVLGEFRDDPKQFDEDIIGLKSLERYYQYYFYQRNDEMSYKVDGRSVIGREDNLFDLLSNNHLSVQAYQRINNDSFPQICCRQSFLAASKAFQAIDSFTRGVIVSYGVGERIINELCASDNLEKQYKLLKEAQRYSVNLFPYEFEKLAGQQIIREVQSGAGIYYLDKQYYSDTFGMSQIAINEMENLIF